MGCFAESEKCVKTFGTVINFVKVYEFYIGTYSSKNTAVEFYSVSYENHYFFSPITRALLGIEIHGCHYVIHGRILQLPMVPLFTKSQKFCGSQMIDFKTMAPVPTRPLLYIQLPLNAYMCFRFYKVNLGTVRTEYHRLKMQLRS